MVGLFDCLQHLGLEINRPQRATELPVMWKKENHREILCGSLFLCGPLWPISI